MRVMKKGMVFGCIFALLLTSTGCTNPDGSTNKQKTGTLIGAGTGALIGSAFGGGRGHIAGALIGAGIGAVAGNVIGASLDAQDRKYQQKAYSHALEYNPTGVSEDWHNPDSEASGVITPKYTYKSKEGAYCREFTQKVVIGSKTEEAVGKACRNPDGTWTIVKS